MSLTPATLQRRGRTGTGRQSVQFHRDGNVYRAVHISGPTHNTLGLQFGNGGEAELVVREVVLDASATPRVDAASVRRQVVEGIARANADLGVTVAVTAIEYVASDSPSPVIYADMAQQIVRRRITCQDAFDGVG